MIAGKYRAFRSNFSPIFEIRGFPRTEDPDKRKRGVNPINAAKFLAVLKLSLLRNRNKKKGLEKLKEISETYHSKITVRHGRPRIVIGEKRAFCKDHRGEISGIFEDCGKSLAVVG